jgi:hypothetical protein
MESPVQPGQKLKVREDPKAYSLSVKGSAEPLYEISFLWMIKG